MLIVDYQSKSYQRFLSDMQKIAKHKTRFLITFNGANESDLEAATKDLAAFTKSTIQNSHVILDKASVDKVVELFTDVRDNRNILLLEGSDLLFDRKTALKKSHERDSGFDLNHLFKNIAKHNGIVVLATHNKHILNASMSTKINVLIRFK